MQPQNQIPFPLKRPFTTAGGVSISSVTVRECTVGDMKNAQRMGGTEAAAVEIALLGIACGMLPDDMERMSLKDYKQVQKRFQQLNDDDPAEGTNTDAGAAGAVVSDAAVGDRQADTTGAA